MHSDVPTNEAGGSGGFSATVKVAEVVPKLPGRLKKRIVTVAVPRACAGMTLSQEIV